MGLVFSAYCRSEDPRSAGIDLRIVRIRARMRRLVIPRDPDPQLYRQTSYRAARPLLASLALLGLPIAVCAAQDKAALAPDAQVSKLREQIENGILPALRIRGSDLRFKLADRMKALRVPAISIAVFENYKIVWTGAYGVLDASSGAAATSRTLFQAASISKPVNAMAVLRVARREKLSLDAPIHSLLRSWKLPDHEWRSDAPVTLRRLLSHTGGTTVHGFGGYPSGAKLPSLLDLLDGKKPANSPPVRVDIRPGSRVRYSGGGTSITQLFLTDQQGASYPEILAREVLRPLGMTESSFEQPLPRERLALAAAGHRRGGDVVASKRHVYPEMAAAGLWTTPRDLARFFLAICKARAGKESPVSKEIARLMTEPAHRGGATGYAGLGVFATKFGETWTFGHSGANEGFRCDASASLDGGFGYVMMTNSDNGSALVDEVTRTVAVARAWPTARPELVRGTLSDEASEAIVGTWSSASGYPIRIVKEAAGNLRCKVPFEASYDLVPLSEDELADPRTGARISLRSDKASIELRTPRQRPERLRRVADGVKLPVLELADGRTDGAHAAWAGLGSERLEQAQEVLLNDAGYKLLAQGKTAKAVEILRFVTVVRPKSSNAFDSLGEALAMHGETAKAIAAYEIALSKLEADTTIPEQEKPERRAAGSAQLERLRGKR